MTTTEQFQPPAPRQHAVLRPSALPVHERGGGARTTPLVTPSVGSTSFINGITSFDPGTAIPFHSHNCEESVVLLEGDAMLDIAGEQIRLQPMDTTFIPPNVPHRFRNLSPDKPMKILWTYARLDANRTLLDSGATAPISAEHHAKG